MLDFAQSYPRLICRVNNLACGKHTLFLDHPGPQELEQTRLAVTAQAETLRAGGRGDTRAMVSEFVDSTDKYGYLRSLRVFIVGDTVFGGTALVAHAPIVNLALSCCSTEVDVASFLYNCSLLDFLIEDRSFCRMAVKSIQVLGLDIGCIDFLISNDENVLIEANGLWSPSCEWAGGKPGLKAYKANREHWQKVAKCYCQFMDRAELFREMYHCFTQLAEAAGQAHAAGLAR
jgi:hypothetical protein